MNNKPTQPLPPLLRRVLKRVLPHDRYQTWVGRHERHSEALWGVLVDSLAPGATVLDVGAYHGSYSQVVLDRRTDLKVVAFEPNPKEYAVMTTALGATDVVLSPKAVAAESGTARFSLAGEASHLDVNGDSEHDSVEVEVTALDDMIDDDAEVGLVKIDVEGHEPGVLVGGRAMFERCRPVILCEVLTDDAGRKVLAELPTDYTCLRIVENGGLEEASVPDRRAWRDKNWLLVPGERRTDDLS